MRLLATVGILAAFAVLGTNATATIVTYEYTGNPWSFIETEDRDGNPLTRYQNADQQFMTATVAIDTGLLPDNSLANIILEETMLSGGDPLPPESPVISVTLFDGVTTPSSLTKQSGPRALALFRFATDDDGLPASWNIAFDEDPPVLSIFGTPEAGGAQVFWVAQGLELARSDTPGTWVRTVPEPGIAALLGLGLLSFAFQRARAQRR